MAGLFFCLASTRCRAFIFALLQYSQIQAFTALFVSSMQFIPPEHQNRLQGFAAVFPLIFPVPAHTIQQPHKPPMHRLHHTRGHTIKRSTSTDTRYRRNTGHCTGQSSRPIIIRYIRVQHTANHASPAGGQLLPSADCWQAQTHCQQYRPGAPSEGCSVSTCTRSARRLAIWHRVNPAHSTRRAVQQQGARRARGTTGGFPPNFFWAFAR